MANSQNSNKSIYDFKVKNIRGEEVPLETFRGKALVIVNTASQCGLTPQYEGLENLYKKFKDRGLVILGFPSNQFGAQEPGSEAEIAQFCETRFSVTFPLFTKIEVNGPQTHPLYEFLKSSQKGFLGTEAIKWNFTKFLVDKSGNVVTRFAPTTTPEQMETEIENVLR
jgi:glutathione peroxidase